MISPKIVRQIAENFLSPNWQFDTVRSANLNGRADEDWIATFARTGGNAIISGDRAMLDREALVSQISQKGLIAIYLPSKFSQAGRNYQMSYCVYWWEKIEMAIAEASPGSILLSPNGMGAGDLRPYVNKRALRRAKQEANRKA
jgi:hypothetical protein